MHTTEASASTCLFPYVICMYDAKTLRTRACSVQLCVFDITMLVHMCAHVCVYKVLIDELFFAHVGFWGEGTWGSKCARVCCGFMSVYRHVCQDVRECVRMCVCVCGVCERVSTCVHCRPL